MIYLDWNNINRDRDTSGLGPIEYDQSKVPALIRKHADNVRTKTYGQEVREAQARNAELAGLIASEAESKANNADLLSKDTQNRFKDQIEGTTNSDEVIDARRPFGGIAYQTIHDRLANLSVSVSVKDYGAVGDGVFDDTDAINQTIENHSHIFIPDGTFMIDAEKFIRLKSNRQILMSKNAILKVIPNGNAYYSLFYLNTVSNVKITGGKLIGDRDEHTGTTGEWGHGIEMRGCTNITIEDLETNDFWGDGLYIGVSGQKNYCENIKLINFSADNNRRQGMSVISVDGLYGDRVSLTNTNGTSPEAGVDFEPNKSTEILRNIHFKDLHTAGNSGAGILKHLSQLSGRDNLISMTFERYVSDGDGIGTNYDMLNAESGGFIKYIDPIIKNSKRRGIGFRSFSSKGPHVDILNPEIINPNRSQTSSTTEGAAISLFRSANDYPDVTDFKMGNVKITNPKVRFEEGLTSPVSSSVSFTNQAGDIKDFFEKIEFEFDEPVGRDFQILNALRLTKSKISHNIPNEFPSTLWFGDIGQTITTEYTLPSSTRFEELITLGTDRNTSVRLTSNVADDMPFSIKIKSDGNNGWNSYVRPPVGERLWPLNYSKGSGKGLQILSTQDGTGMSVTVRRINGKWVVEEIIGTWTVEP